MHYQKILRGTGSRTPSKDTAIQAPEVKSDDVPDEHDEAAAEEDDARVASACQLLLALP